MYFHAPCGVVLYSVMCFYIVECNYNFMSIRKSGVYSPHYFNDNKKNI